MEEITTLLGFLTGVVIALTITFYALYRQRQADEPLRGWWGWLARTTRTPRYALVVAFSLLLGAVISVMLNVVR